MVKSIKYKVFCTLNQTQKIYDTILGINTVFIHILYIFLDIFLIKKHLEKTFSLKKPFTVN